MSANTATAILGRMIEPELPTFSPDAARSILSLVFQPDDQARVDNLLERNQEGLLTTEERDELQEYLRANDLLSLLKSKARLSLRLSEQTVQAS